MDTRETFDNEEAVCQVFFEEALEIKAYDGFVDNFQVVTTSTFDGAFHPYVQHKLKCHL